MDERPFDWVSPTFEADVVRDETVVFVNAYRFISFERFFAEVASCNCTHKSMIQPSNQ